MENFQETGTNETKITTLKILHNPEKGRQTCLT